MLRHRLSVRQRGSILVTTLILCIIAAVSSLWMVQTLHDQQKINTRRRDIERAYFAAEAGVAQVIHWGNTPADYDSATGLFYRNPTTGAFPNLSAALSSGTEYELDSDKFGQFASKYTYAVAHVEELALSEYDSGSDPVECLFKVRSVGETPSGIRRQVTAYIQANPIAVAEIKLPAALISMGTAGQNGNGKVHWGEAWGRDDFEVLNRSMFDYVIPGNSGYDQWAKYRTEADLVFASNWQWGEGKHLYDPTRRFPGEAPATGNYAAAFEQHIPPGVLQWPDMLSQYQTLKEMAMAHGRYYTTDAAGNVYEGAVKDAAHKVVFNDEFGEADRVNSPYDLVFIDTINGQPPAANGSNLATITNSGTGLGMKGVFYICANFTQTGAGNPASLVCEKPDSTSQSISKVYLDGVLYSAGWMDLGGNPIVYGSVVAEKGFASGGTPEVYYNHRLKNGLELPKGNVGSVFRIAMQKNEGISE